MSGDNRTENYNEPKAMRAYAIRHSVPSAAIELDYAGRDTYDTCYRAKRVFGVDKAIFITQEYHAPRTVFLARALGIESTAFAVKNLPLYSLKQMSFDAREVCADVKAVWDVAVSHRRPYVAMVTPPFRKLRP
jgi:vancomycin permeability regulator SanA